MLSTLKLKLYKEGPEGTLAYGEGVGEVAGLLAERLGLTVPDALRGHGLNWEQLDDASRDLFAVLEKAGPMLKSEVQSVRTAAHKQVVGCLLLGHLYRLRFIATQASREQQTAAVAMADGLSEFAHIMVEIGVRLRAPSEAYA
ncbi:hypothetical protein [Bradyrhizobium diazoefficiens]|uniref:hypothetical protein n=1 Tax=Bradyrhizobium diazoefficiens TaxID=1355477 RepID=UPI0027153F56|nr:hypothetical protein [Bradyrhizobium diazoefficiens]WLB40272.1 hypothetical protein QIH78_10925 [Bradyrhizobium diazoefficiens]WLC14754.1 hypothetical protein QIH76_32125 [Bradyrhizobium diazoefficiens]